MESALKYDPLEAPELEEWLAIDEAERIQLAQDYHRAREAPRRGTPAGLPGAGELRPCQEAILAVGRRVF
jgi:hypothetical protein